jgi:hypothetical protein
MKQRGKEMKLPEEKEEELEKQGKPKLTPVPGGGAMGRLRQFEKERGLNKTNPEQQTTKKPAKAKTPKRSKR